MSKTELARYRSAAAERKRKSRIRKKSGRCGELLDLVLQTLPEVQDHTRVKRIQSDAFASLKEASRIFHIDFAMA